MPEGLWFFVGATRSGDRGATPVERGRLVVWHPGSPEEERRVLTAVRANANDLETVGVEFEEYEAGTACEDYSLAGTLRNDRGDPVAGAAPATLGRLLQGYWGDLHLVAR